VKLQSLEDTETDSLAAYMAQSVHDHEQIRVALLTLLADGRRVFGELEVYRLQDANVARDSQEFCLEEV